MRSMPPVISARLGRPGTKARILLSVAASSQVSGVAFERISSSYDLGDSIEEIHEGFSQGVQ
jgi:hypothetical protein